MKKIVIRSASRLGFFIAMLSAVAISCSKKETVPAPVAAPAAAEAPAAPAAAAQTAPLPVVEDAAAVNARIARAQAALKAKDYEQAAAALTISRQTPVPMTGEQLQKYNVAVGNLQSQVAAAAAAGDPRAKAVYEAMRQRALEHR